MNAIKTWEFEDEFSWQKTKIILFKNRVEIFKGFNEVLSTYSFDQVFEHKSPLADLKTDYELLKEIILHVDRETLSTKAKQVFDFYSFFENYRIHEKTIELDVKVFNSERYFYTMTTFGIRSYYERDGQSFGQYNQRFSSFFFEGPQKLKIDLNIRKEWRLTLWKSLANNPYIKINHAFVIFDYEKIKVTKYDYHNPEKGEGKYLYIHQGRVDAGGWSLKNAAGYPYSIEELWYSDSIICSEFAQHKPEIRKILEAAIIESNAGFLKDEEPNQAPPA